MIIEMIMKWIHVYDFLYINVVSRPSLAQGVVGPGNRIEGLVPWLPSTGVIGPYNHIEGFVPWSLARGMVDPGNHIEGFVPLSPLQGGGRPWKVLY